MGHIATGSFMGRGNQFIQFLKFLCCKLPTTGKKSPIFPHSFRGLAADLRGGRQCVTTAPPWPLTLLHGVCGIHVPHLKILTLRVLHQKYCEYAILSNDPLYLLMILMILCIYKVTEYPTGHNSNANIVCYILMQITTLKHS